MELDQLSEQANEVVRLSKYMSSVFGGDHETYLKIAIMAGIEKGYRIGITTDALRREREVTDCLMRIEDEKKVTPEIKEQILTLAKTDKIGAIKYIKAKTGMLLKEAKEVVERMMAENNNNETV